MGRVWEIMRQPRYCLAHYSGIPSNITKATDFRIPLTPFTLAHQPPYTRWYNTHVTHAGALPTLARQPRHPRKHATHTTQASTDSTPFLKLKSSLLSNFYSVLFHQIFLIFPDVLFFPSFLLQNCSKNGISIWNFLLCFGKVSVVICKSQMTMFQYLAWGYLRRFSIASPGIDNLRKKGCRKDKEVLVCFF